jgi:hypothetical protein
MSGSDYFAPGDWNVVCYDCGRKFKASMMRRNWQGFYECPEHWTPRQPQDFVRSIQTPPWVQPMPQDQFAISDFLCTESSDESDFNPMIYICTETLYPLETET